MAATSELIAERGYHGMSLAAVVSELPGQPSSTPATGPLPITFGTALDPDTYLVTQPATSFHHSDPFAYSVNPAVNPGVPDVYVGVLQYRGGEQVVLLQRKGRYELPHVKAFRELVEQEFHAQATGA